MKLFFRRTDAGRLEAAASIKLATQDCQRVVVET